MTRPADPPEKAFTLYCPRLGHPVPFLYCRRENLGLPCVKSLHCWTPYFRVEEYLRAELSPEEWHRCFVEPGPSRLDSLLEKINQADRLRTRQNE